MRIRVSTFSTFILAAYAAACSVGTESSHQEAPKVVADTDDPFLGIEQTLTPLATQCTFTSATGLMTVAIGDGETAIVARRGADSAILVNGYDCDVPVTATAVKKVKVTGTSGVNSLIIDFTNGLFAMGTSSAASSGWEIDLGGGSDTLGVKGTSGNDNFTFGATGLLFNTDAHRDATIDGVETVVVSLGAGDDTYSGGGATAVGGAFPLAVTLYGGAGNDTFNQGTVATANETIFGGSGTDTVSYAQRSADVTVTIGDGVSGGGTANDGVTGESDDIEADVEAIVGGAGNDTLTAAAGVGATLSGGPGNDTLIGDSGNDTLNGGAGNDILRGKAGNDILNGDAGDDLFDEETASNGSDVFNGGAGIDTIDYSGRTNKIVVTMDGLAANDGEVGENDNVKGDVENIKGGAGDDEITGNALNNRIEGGDGDDILVGGAGDDVFVAGEADDGDDVISGGAGVDTVDYSARTADLLIRLDGTAGSGVAGEVDTINADVENATGGGGDDTIYGNASDNILVGGVGEDTLYGLAGDDTLEGGAGDDTIDCGPDFDINVGAIGTDTVSNCEVTP